MSSMKFKAGILMISVSTVLVPVPFVSTEYTIEVDRFIFLQVSSRFAKLDIEPRHHHIIIKFAQSPSIIAYSRELVSISRRYCIYRTTVK